MHPVLETTNLFDLLRSHPMFCWSCLNNIVCRVNVFCNTSVGCSILAFLLDVLAQSSMNKAPDSHLWRVALLHCPVFQIARRQREKKKWWEQKSSVSNFLNRKDQMYKAKIVLVLVRCYQSLPNLQHCKASLFYNFVLQRHDVSCFVSLSRNDINF